VFGATHLFSHQKRKIKLLANKHILLGVTGSIAAYKSAELVRRLCDAGAEVQVVMTRAGVEFITPLTMQSLSGRPVYLHHLDTETEAAMGHISLARWADMVLIAPASADFMARLAQGRADDLLSSICLAHAGPFAVAPAMNRQMWAQASTQANVQILLDRGFHLFGPGDGDQACGEIGPGRMLEPLQIVEKSAALFDTGLLQGCRVLINAGPTQEDIDPVRYISNRSSGKMGFAIAEAAVEAGALVTLVAGPVALKAPDRVSYESVRSAAQMREQVLKHIPDQDIFIATAAVVDYRAAQIAPRKAKKQSRLTLELECTPDILCEVTAMSRPPFTVGFAAETENVEAYARSKLQEKALDMIVANEVGRHDRGFDSDNNELLVLWKEGQKKFPLGSKRRLARELIKLIAERYDAKGTCAPSGA